MVEFLSEGQAGRLSRMSPKTPFVKLSKSLRSNQLVCGLIDLPPFLSSTIEMSSWLWEDESLVPPFLMLEPVIEKVVDRTTWAHRVDWVP